MKTSEALTLLAERAVLYPDVPSGQLMSYTGDGARLTMSDMVRMTMAMESAGVMPHTLTEIIEANNPNTMHEARVLAYLFAAIIAAEQGD